MSNLPLCLPVIPRGLNHVFMQTFISTRDPVDKRKYPRLMFIRQIVWTYLGAVECLMNPETWYIERVERKRSTLRGFNGFCVILDRQDNVFGPPCEDERERVR